MKRGAWRKVIQICRSEYQAKDDPADGARLALAFLHVDEPLTAKVIARRLLGSAASPEAHDVMARVSQDEDDEEASLHYSAAFVGYLARGDAASAVKMAYGLSSTLHGQGERVGAAVAWELAGTLARIAGVDKSVYIHARLSAAEPLHALGSFYQYERELQAVWGLLDGETAARSPGLAPRQQAFYRRWTLLKLGIARGEQENYTLARLDLQKALATATRAKDHPVVVAALLNLAWVALLEEKIEESLAYVDRAEQLGAVEDDVRMVRGQALLEGRRFAEAISELDRAQELAPKGESAWAVPYLRGRAAEETGDPAAEDYYRSSQIEVADLVERAGTFSPQVTAAHRQPYQRLFGIHARRGAWKEALGLLLELDSLALLPSEIKAKSGGLLDPLGTPWKEPPSLAGKGAVEAALQQWAHRHLVVLFSDEQLLWRLELREGRVSGRMVGDADQAEALAHQLRGQPGSVEAASKLGALFLPPLSSSDRRTLEVLAIGPLAAVPLALLRRGDQLALAATPLARPLGLLPRSRIIAARAGAVVLGDPSGDLPEARKEAGAVAARLGVAPVLGEAVDALALAEAEGKAFLHVAAHSKLDREGPRLVLAKGGSFRLADLTALDPAPTTVVLASCKSAAARDDGSWGSLAGAFIKAGSDAVIATSKDVDDAASHQLVLEMLQHDVVNQPVQALAKAQLAAAKAGKPARDWAYFTVLLAPP